MRHVSFGEDYATGGNNETRDDYVKGELPFEKKLSFLLLKLLVLKKS